MTGHSYIVYGPLLNGVHTLLFEGTPTYPGPDRLWATVRMTLRARGDGSGGIALLSLGGRSEGQGAGREHEKQGT